VQGSGVSAVQWPAIFAGAIAAAALALVLQTFAIATGLAVSSTSPTWRDTSFALVFLSGLYLLLASIAAYGFGGYVAGRLALRSEIGSADTAEFQDGMRGLLSWALATLFAGIIAIAAVQTLPRSTTPGTANASLSVTGESLIAYDLDLLFRSPQPRQEGISALRSEAARILLTTTGHAGMSGEDRAHLVRLVEFATGLAAADADRRVAVVAARARDDLNRARRSAVLIGFMLGASTLLGALAAWYAACAAGRHRDGRAALSAVWDWGKDYERQS
jgi:hypothetical protein